MTCVPKGNDLNSYGPPCYGFGISFCGPFLRLVLLVLATALLVPAGSYGSIPRMEGTTTAIAGGISEARAYSLDGLPLTNRISGNGIVPDAEIICRYDAAHAGLRSMRYTIDGEESAIGVAWNSRTLVREITNEWARVSYGYSTNATWVTNVTVEAGALTLRKTKN